MHMETISVTKNWNQPKCLIILERKNKDGSQDMISANKSNTRGERHDFI